MSKSAEALTDPSARFEALEKRIGYTFTDHTDLATALTHASAKKERAVDSDYERLEFLGDRVLGICMAELLFKKFPDDDEGHLNVRFSALVNGKVLAEISDHIGLHEFMTTGGDVKHLKGKRMQSVRADVLEALIAAIYLDGGLAKVADFIVRIWGNRIDEIATLRRDSKTELQEWAHSKGHPTPRYSEVGRKGPDHDPEFTVLAIVDGVTEKQGMGKSKRTAEQAAAQEILVEQGVWQNG